MSTHFFWREKTEETMQIFLIKHRDRQIRQADIQTGPRIDRLASNYEYVYVFANWNAGILSSKTYCRLTAERQYAFVFSAMAAGGNKSGFYNTTISINVQVVATLAKLTLDFSSICSQLVLVTGAFLLKMLWNAFMDAHWEVRFGRVKGSVP